MLMEDFQIQTRGRAKWPQFKHYSIANKSFLSLTFGNIIKNNLKIHRTSSSNQQKLNLKYFTSTTDFKEISATANVMDST